MTEQLQQVILSAAKYHTGKREVLSDRSSFSRRLEVRPVITQVRLDYLPMNAFYSLTRAAKTHNYPYIDIASSVEVDAREKPELFAVIEASHREAVRRESQIQYPSSHGLRELHTAIAADFNRWGGIDIDPYSEVTVTAGIMGAYKKVLAAFDLTHVVIPSYCPYFARAFAELEGKVIVEAPLDLQTGQLSLADVESRLQELGADPAKTLFYITHPSAPAGTIMQDSFIEGQFLPFIDRMGMTFFSDSYIRATRFDTDGYILPILSYAGAIRLGVEAITIAKEMGLPGVRVGGLAGNRHIIQGIKEFSSASIDMLPEEPQITAAMALERIDPSFVGRRIAAELHEQIIPRFKAMGWYVIEPKAGIDMMVGVPPNFIREDIADPSLLAAISIFRHYGVAISPASVFGPDGRKFLRLVLKQEVGVIPSALDTLQRNGFDWATYGPNPEDILAMDQLISALDLTKL